MENLFYLIPLSGLLAVVFGLMRSKWISDQNPGNEKMQEIGLAIREGATAFLVREYKVLTIFVLTVAALLYWVCLLYTSPSPRDKRQSRMPSSA